MYRNHWLNAFPLLILLAGCGSSLPDMPGFDEAGWKGDKNGCNKTRKSSIDIIAANKDLLLGLNQNEMADLLGKPDEHELYERNQKFFYYYITPGPKCTDPATNPTRLQIRFNAMGMANEIAIENPQNANLPNDLQ